METTTEVGDLVEQTALLLNAIHLLGSGPAAFVQLQEDVVNINTAAAALQAQTVAAQQSTTALQAVVDGHTGELGTLTTDLAARIADITALQSMDTSQAAQIAAIEALQTTHGAQLTALSNDLTLALSQSAAANTTAAAASATAGNALAAAQANTVEIGNLHATDTATAATLTTVQSTANGAAAAAATNASGLTALTTALALLDARVVALETAPPVVHPVEPHAVSVATVTITGQTAETTLYTFTRPGGTWAPGDMLRFIFAGLMSNNDGTKRMRIRINGTERFYRQLASNTQHPWQMRGSLFVRSATEAVLVTHLDNHARRIEHETSIFAFDPSVANTLELSGDLSDVDDTITLEMAGFETVRHGTV